MRKSLLLLMIFIGSLTLGMAQYEDMVKNRLNEALEAHLVNLSPPKGCECSSCSFNYAQAMKIEKTRPVDNMLQVWGKAKVTYKSSFEGAGTTAVTFFAECIKQDGQIYVRKLKWQTNKCMRLTDIM